MAGGQTHLIGAGAVHQTLLTAQALLTTSEGVDATQILLAVSGRIASGVICR